MNRGPPPGAWLPGDRECPHPWAGGLLPFPVRDDATSSLSAQNAPCLFLPQSHHDRPLLSLQRVSSESTHAGAGTSP